MTNNHLIQALAFLRDYGYVIVQAQVGWDISIHGANARVADFEILKIAAKRGMCFKT